LSVTTTSTAAAKRWKRTGSNSHRPAAQVGSSKGRVDDQRSVLNFRSEAKDSLPIGGTDQRRAEVFDGQHISYAYNTDGSLVRLAPKTR
jgi:hypothetical protein